MKRADWFKRLDEMAEEITEPICPSFCCFTQICPEWAQRGINQLFVDGRFKRRDECMWFQEYARFYRATFETSPPKSAAEFFEIVIERRAIREEATS